MKDKKTIYTVVGVVAIILIIFFAAKSNDVSAPSPEELEGKQEETSSTPSANAGANKGVAVTYPVTSTEVDKDIKITSSPVEYPEIDFINKKLVIEIEDFPDVDITIQKVVFGRGDAAISTGCTGIPNANFGTLLYPGSGICIKAEKVDGVARGILALHLLIENNGNIGFGGNPNTFRLHYLRSNEVGETLQRFAEQLAGLGSHYVGEYSSEEIILSYLVPEDQLVYDLVSGYEGPDLENQTLNIYDLSAHGVFVDFGLKDIKIIK